MCAHCHSYTHIIYMYMYIHVPVDGFWVGVALGCGVTGDGAVECSSRLDDRLSRINLRRADSRHSEDMAQPELRESTHTLARLSCSWDPEGSILTLSDYEKIRRDEHLISVLFR